MAFTAQQHKEHRAHLKDKGLCVRCHRAETQGKAICSECQKHNAEYTNRRRETGLYCHDCLRKLDDFSVMSGLKSCSSCLEREVIRQYRRRHNNA